MFQFMFPFKIFLLIKFPINTCNYYIYDKMIWLFWLVNFISYFRNHNIDLVVVNISDDAEIPAELTKQVCILSFCIVTRNI